MSRLPAPIVIVPALGTVLYDPPLARLERLPLVLIEVLSLAEAAAGACGVCTSYCNVPVIGLRNLVLSDDLNSDQPSSNDGNFGYTLFGVLACGILL